MNHKLAHHSHYLQAADISDALDGRKSGAGFICCCPAHSDRSPSLSIKDGENGKVLLHCFAGCSFTEIINTLRPMGLWPEQKLTRRITSKYSIKQINHAKTVLHLARCDIRDGYPLSNADNAYTKKQYNILKEMHCV